MTSFIGPAGINMRTLSRLIANRTACWVIVVTTLILAAISAWMAQGMEQQDDVLAFLPEGNPEITMFREINEAFGGMDVTLVGIETTAVITPDPSEWGTMRS